MVYITRLLDPNGQPLESFHVHFSPPGLDSAGFSTRLNSWQNLFTFLTAALHFEHQDAEDILIRVQLDGRFSRAVPGTKH